MGQCGVSRAACEHLWAARYEAGELDEEAEAADLLQRYEANIAALERLVGRQALEIEFLKGAQENRVRPKNGLCSDPPRTLVNSLWPECTRTAWRLPTSTWISANGGGHS